MKKIAMMLGFKTHKPSISNDSFITEFLLVLLFILISLIFPLFSSAQKGKDGAESYTSSGTRILNRYAALAYSAGSGATNITVTSISDLSGSTSFTNSVNPYTTATLSPGDLIFIIQMQGADINTTNTSSYGEITNYNGAGDYEFKTVLRVSGNRIYFCDPLNNSYYVGDRKRVQVIRVPRLTTLSQSGGSANTRIITARPWNGTIGGVCVIEIDGNLTFANGATIQANEIGFRGGTKASANVNFGATNYRSTDANDGAEKGEGIAGNQSDYNTYLSGKYGRGAPANGGGGGNNHNGGGGGGSNAGSLTGYNGTGVKPSGYNSAWNLEGAGFSSNVSPGGGRGGYTYSANNRNASTEGPGNTNWGGDNRRNVGGLGGRPLNYNTNSKLFMGGGGGSGEMNDGYGGSGGNGGGIVFLIVNGTVSGTGSITATGQNGYSTTNSGQDGPGGGGGGGAVVILASSTISNVTISANGGAGGSQSISGMGDEGEGPGGGGGGGYIYTTNTSVTRTTTGGNNGTTNSPGLTEFPPNGATIGGAGTTSNTATYAEVAVSCFDAYSNNSSNAICGEGYVTLMTTLVKNGDFSLSITSPSSGNTFTASNTSTAGTTYNFSGGNFRAQADYAGGSSNHRFDIRTGNYTSGDINQDPFPGDPTYNVPATNTWIHHNGNNLGGERVLWYQEITGLINGKTYTFYFYASNVYNSGNSNQPIINLRTGGSTGLPDGTLQLGPATLTEAATSNSQVLKGWVRFSYTFTASATSLKFKITDSKTGNTRDEVGITAIGMSMCETICGAPQAESISGANTIINTYYPATASVSAGATRIQVGTKRTEGSVDNIQPGDLLMVIQMQGSAINSTNTNNYGANNGTSRGYTSTVAGTYEYVYAASSVVSGIVYLATPLKKSYTNADATASAGQYRFQVVRVPQYATLNIANGASITNAEWNGATGGIIAANVAGTMTFNGGVAINASALGFRGGGGRQLSGGSGASSDRRTLSSNNANGSKGEGIAGTPKYTRSLANVLVDNGAEGYPNGSYAQGAPGNAGGGGTDGNVSANDENTGGGGGGNGGIGGRGGKGWNNSAQDGGYGGGDFSEASSTRLVLGGGGGAGTTNNGTGSFGNGFNSSGGSGGGMVFLRVAAVSGTGTINANGADGLSVENDGGGGGGAGGSVYLYATNTSGMNNITINARGGNGGNAWASEPDNGTPNDGNPEHGPGGGGGGGVIYTNASVNASSSVAGGNPGISTTGNYPYGATVGTVGKKLTSATNAMLDVVKVFCDIDDDDDGIADVIENANGGADAFLDDDGDGIPNVYDPTPGSGVASWVDVNGDGINDNFDQDLDGIINELDLDSDNDGITDVVESYGVDENGDGKIDNFVDANGDGLSDNAANTSSVNGLGAPDFDGDGIPNYLDLDSDNDGIPDIVEVGGADTNNDGMVDSFSDNDFNGLHNNYTGASNALLLSGPDTNNNGVADSWPFKNQDRTGRPNLYDLDSDGDGITDAEESGLIGRTGTNGTVASSAGIITGTRTFGWANSVIGLTSLNLRNTDSRGQADYLDIDSDDDGITDNVEAQSTGGYKIPNDTDTDGDGIADIYEMPAQVGVYGGNGLTPFDKDGDGTPDYRDTDADNDGVPDYIEGSGATMYGKSYGTLNFTDTDGDGLVDQWDNVNINTLTTGNYYKNVTHSEMGTNGDRNGPTPSGSKAGLPQHTWGSSPDRDWRNNQILPLNIIEFAVNYSTPNAIIKWEVQNELQTNYYDVEFSLNGTEFSKIFTIAAKNIGHAVYGQLHNLENYHQTIFYYRIKQVDKDGKIFYTEIATIRLSRNTEIKVSPNPFKNYFNLHYTSSFNERVSVSLISLDGKLITSKQIDVMRGNNTIQFNELNNLPIGMYILKVQGNNQLSTFKLIKE
ncbi:MAG: T9SS type A sorting domain-containing protein [Chitinophagaceae bacterium]|nr:T9SS type A sorting domain-containing protein [Chitinophagaceae bacterium]MCW5905901.1 T9SS type A sorting domain-containing protein [Chitinophagaceae bacterium]